MTEAIELLKANLVIFYLLTFIFSLCVGSFLNVVIYRLPLILNEQWTGLCSEFLNQPYEKKYTDNLFFPPSSCPNCNNRLKFWHNIPVISYLFLKGKCYFCKVSISPRYPLVELLTACLSLLVVIQFGVSDKAIYGLLFTWVVISLALIDYDTQLLPDNLTLPLLWLGLLVNCFDTFVPLKEAVLSAAGAYLALWLFTRLFYLITKKEGMGEGDLKLYAAFGAWMGYQVLPLILIFASLIGAIIGITVLSLQKKDKDTPLPFGPYLCITGFISFLWGPDIIRWYLSLYM